MSVDVDPLHAGDEELVPGCLEVKLPTLEEQAIKQDTALNNLESYVLACGGALPTGWECSLRFRITTRRHGRQGLTTDNFYYSPCGKTFRTHKQVAEFLGLQPVSRQQLRQQQEAQDPLALGSSPRFHIVSVTLGTAVQLSRRVHNQCAKRTQSAMLPPAADEDCLPCTSAQQAAASAPAALPASNEHTVSSDMATAACQGGCSASELTQEDHSRKRTKRSIVARFGSCGNISLSQQAAAPFSESASAVSSTSASCTFRGAITSNCHNTAVELPSAAVPGDSDLTALEKHQNSTATLQVPCILAAASSTAGSTVSMRTDATAVCSRLAPVAAPRLPQPPYMLQKQQQQRRQQEAQPPPQRKPRQPAAWKTKLRELATQAAAEQGIIPSSSSTSSQHQLSCCLSDV